MFLILCFLCWFPAVYSEVRLTQQSPLDLPCSGEDMVLQCTIQERLVFWRFPGGNEVLRPTSSKQQFGNFQGCPVGVVNGNFTSTLTFPAENGTVITCSNVNMNRSTSLTVTVQDPLSAPTLSCVELSEDVTSRAVNVTVSWTLSGGDSADFYLINITTNAPQTPYGGLLNITTASVTQHELTGFMTGYEYSITVRGVSENCVSQEGSESEPLTIRPQVPATPAPVVFAVFDVNRALQSIEATWNESNVTIPEDCANGQDIYYEVIYTTDSGALITTCNVSGTECSNGRCYHELQNSTANSRCQPPVSQFSGESVTVFVTARNIVGRSGPSSPVPINDTNTYLEVHINPINPRNTSVECTFFQPGYNCTIDYGTNTNLVYRDTSFTPDQMGTITLSQRLRKNTTYFYTVSVIPSESSSLHVKTQGRFRLPCFLEELWNLSATDFTFLPDVSSLDAAAQYPSCDDESVGSVALRDTTLNTATVVCYNDTTAGSTACFVCDEESEYALNTTTSERVCLSNGTWSGSPIICECRLPPWITALIVVAVIAVFFAVVSLIIEIIHWQYVSHSKKVPWISVITVLLCLTGVAIAMILYRYKKGKGVNLSWWWNMIAGVLNVAGVALCIAAFVVLFNPPNGNACDPSWRPTRDGLTCLAFAFSMLAYIFIGALSGFHVYWYRKYDPVNMEVRQIVLLLTPTTIFGVGFWIAFKGFF